MPAAAKKLEAKKDPVAEAARRALDDAGGDVREATTRLETAVRKSQPLRDALTEPLLANACYDAVRNQVRLTRAASWKEPTEKLVPSKSGVAGAHRVVQLATGTLLMFPLPGGKKLGEASRKEISGAADFYASQSADMGAKARWLRLIGQHVTGDKKVGEVLTEKRLRELQKEAQRDD